MAAAPEQSTSCAGGLSLTTTTGVMIAAIMFLLTLFLLVFFLYLRRKQCWGAIPAFGRPAAVRPGPNEPAATVVLPGGLDAAAIKALPSCVFRLEGAAEAMECAVCISELADGEPARLLPKCGHGFHLDCVDTWLRSNSTCPVCRCAVVAAPKGDGDCGAADAGARPAESAVSGDGSATEGAAAAPTGNSGPREGASLVESTAIEIPRRAAEGLPAPASPLTPAVSAAEEVRSAAAARLRTLRRLLIIGNRGLGSPCSPRGRDIEQGIPKAPSSS